MTEPPPATAQYKLSGTYWRTWWAAAIDNVGDGAYATALPLFAVTLTDNAVLIAGLTAASFAPWLLFSLPVGAMVDSRDRATLMRRSQLVQAVILTVLSVLVLLHRATIVELILVALVLGCCEVVFGTAAQSVLPQIVPAQQLPRANGLFTSAISTCQQFIGPPVGGLLLALGAYTAFGLNALSFVVSAALLTALPVAPRRATAGQSMRGAIGEGVRWLYNHRLLRGIAVLAGINSFCYAMATATQVLLATHTLQLSARCYGLLLGLAAIGSIAGGLASARLLQRLGPLTTLTLALAISAAMTALAGLSPNAVVLAAALGIAGFAGTGWSVLAVSLRQQLVPEHLLGRVNSAYRLIGWGTLPLGSLTGGLLAAGYGYRLPYAVAAALRAVTLVAYLPALATMLPRSPKS